MKTSTTFQVRAILALFIAAFAPSVFAAITIPGANGTDGPLNITSSTNIDLGLAVTGPWDNNNTTNTGKGVYDPSKWAVVFKYSSVNIANGATVTFSNHPSRAPVVWLVSGNVTNDGVVNLDGAAGGAFINRPETAPGGFRGGDANGAGYGPGGAGNNEHGQFGPGQPRSYGNAQIVPLIGGSGGSYYNGYSGGGGGAILVAASGTIAISANGRFFARGGFGSAYGSGGAIRLIADQIAGNGAIDVAGLAYPGRVRLEANVVSPSLGVTPITQAVSPNPVVLWPPANAPTVRVVSVSGQAAPAEPKVVLENNPADVNVATTNAVTILLQTMNFPTNGTVNVFIKPRNAAPTTYEAAWVSGTTNASSWQVQHALLPGYSVIQARAVAQ